jgi:hypothetical protein
MKHLLPSFLAPERGVHGRRVWKVSAIVFAGLLLIGMRPGISWAQKKVIKCGFIGVHLRKAPEEAGDKESAGWGALYAYNSASFLLEVIRGGEETRGEGKNFKKPRKPFSLTKDGGRGISFLFFENKLP